MNFVFSVVLILSIVVLMFSNPDNILSSLIAGTGNGISFAIKLFAIYAVWLSILKIWEKMNFGNFIAKKTSPMLRKIFPNESQNCYTNLSINLSANFLGMGSAGTPAGINASKSMISPKNRTMLLVINSTSIQLIPTTIVAMRSTHFATTDIILPTLISTSISTFLGVILVKFFVKK